MEPIEGALIPPAIHSVAEIVFIGVWLFNVRPAARPKLNDTVAFGFEEEPIVIVFDLLTSLTAKLVSEPDNVTSPRRLTVLAVILLREPFQSMSPTLIPFFAAIVSCDLSPVPYIFI